jgi:hypothetical protein
MKFNFYYEKWIQLTRYSVHAMPCHAILQNKKKSYEAVT